ncbi:MAG: hypothetical protein AAF518_03840 [Spirochaetota bacterium]
MAILLYLSTILLSSYLLHKLYVQKELFPVIDMPNQRSMHERPTKKSAGVLFIFLFLASLWIFPVLFFPDTFLQTFLIPLTIALVFSSGIGFVDDLYNLSSVKKLLLELAFFLPLCYFLEPKFTIFGVEFSPVLASGICCLYVVFVMNLCNFMDGLDLYLLVSFLTSITLLYVSDLKNLPVVIYWMGAPILVASLFGFFRYNFPPAKVFMGDSGSLPLGVLIALLPFCSGIQAGATDLSYSFFFIPLFWLDGIVTLLSRIYQRENIFQAHRLHLYQRICKHWSKKKTCFLLGLSNLLAAPFIYLFAQKHLSFYMSFLGCLLVFLLLYSFLLKKYNLKLVNHEQK